MNYYDFISSLKHLNCTQDVLIYIFNYFKNFVSYNYDQLQVVKFNRYYEEPLLNKVIVFLNENKGNRSALFKNKVIEMLDEAFISIENRPLSDENKKRWFKNFGTVIHHDEIKERKIGSITIKGKPAYDEILYITANSYRPVYKNGMLTCGVCNSYSNFVLSILRELNIPCFKVIGKGTTGHAWNLIYIEEKNIWVNFDMTMVRFYLDNWSKKYGKPEKWVFASTTDMFKMQKERKIERLEDFDGRCVLSKVINSENAHELELFLAEYSKNLKQTIY